MTRERLMDVAAAVRVSGSEVPPGMRFVYLFNSHSLNGQGMLAGGAW